MAEQSLLNTTFPVMLPDMPELRMPRAEFDAHIRRLLRPAGLPVPVRTKADPGDDPRDISGGNEGANTATEDSKSTEDVANRSRFMQALLSNKSFVPTLDERDGKMLTENADVAYRTSGNALVDVFFELEDAISGKRLKEVLEKAWADDSEATLKIIWNARSIHLGKSSRKTFYRAMGWLAENHPLTLFTNLQWLVRPLISKKAPNKEDVPKKDIDGKGVDGDFELIGNDGELEMQPQQKKLKLDDDAQLAGFDIKYGVSHGYWKDLLNILALAASGELKVDGDPKKVLNVEKPEKKEQPYRRDWTQGRKKGRIAEWHTDAVNKLENGGFYKALHLTVARLFADQLQTDLARLKSGSKMEIKSITLAAKWAPTHKGMHDQHTCIVSSIAEILHPFDSVCPDTVDPGDRETYLKYARIAYQSQTLSPLRKHLEVVERPITAERFGEIKYDRVPALAMQQYTPLFAKKDFEHFDQYIEKVAAGKANISGATLLPSTLVHAIGARGSSCHLGDRPVKGADAMVQQKLRNLQLKTIDGQWNSLVQRIRDSGTLESSIAVCDVSGSMTLPVFADGTCPMESAIGLSLLVAEVTKPPFGGAFITFSATPEVLRVGGLDDERSLFEKAQCIANSAWDGNTNFVAVFENLILPMAIEHGLKQEDMVKQIFVFSDMQFDQADGGRHGGDRWTTSYERIQEKFKHAGYEMPSLIFWNLAGGRAGYGATGLDDEVIGDDTAPKPVTAAEEGTALVSGYSQGQMKMFLDNGSFEDPEAEADMIEKEEPGGDGEVVVEKVQKNKKDPLTTVKKAISHEAYRMLKVVD